MEDNRGYKYVIRIPALFILGVTFTIWGLIMICQGIENRKNLNKIYDETVNYENIRIGNYIQVINPRLAGRTSKDGETIIPNQLSYLALIEYDYYVIDFGDLFIPMKINYTKVRDGFSNKINSKAIVEDTIVFKVEKSDREAIEVLVDAVNNGYRTNRYTGKENIDGAVYSKKYLLTPVSLNAEKNMLFKGIWILFAGIIFIIGSRPWKIIQKEYQMPIKEFNLVYDGQVNKNDMRFLENTAYDLRFKINILKSDYDNIKKNAIRSTLAFLVSLLLLLWIKILMILYILSAVYFIKMLIEAMRLFLNGESRFARNIMTLFNRKPVKQVIKEETGKLEKCMKLIDVCIGVGGEK